MRWKNVTFFSPILLLLLIEHTVATENVTRDDKQIAGGIFSVVTFPNLACRALNGFNGTCMTKSECDTANGEVQGSCAKGFGACCFIAMKTCGGIVKQNRTYIQNPDYPSGTFSLSETESRLCNYQFHRTGPNQCNVRLDFTTFEMGPPERDGSSKWECQPQTTDYVNFNQSDGNMRSGLLICGYNNGQHLYLDLSGENANPGYARMNMILDASHWASFGRIWNILVSYIECGTPTTPPRGCDRYYWGNYGTGIVKAYNYDQPIKKYAARLTGYHTICIRREKGMCQIGYIPPDFDQTDDGFAVNGDPASLFKGRNACQQPSPVACVSYVRIPQGSANGLTPYGFEVPASPPSPRCDRFCGRRLCLNHQGCTSSEHDQVISRVIPFHLNIEMRPHSPIGYENRGYKLNYVQSKC